MLAHLVQLENSLEIHLLYQCWSYWICILLYSNSIRKNVFSILQLFQVQQVQTNVQNLNLILLFIFLSKHKAFYKQIFLEYIFQAKIQRLSIGTFLDTAWKTAFSKKKTHNVSIIFSWFFANDGNIIFSVKRKFKENITFSTISNSFLRNR